MKLRRREFLQIAFGAAAATAFPWPFRALRPAEAKPLPRYGKGWWIPSCCNTCSGQCGVLCFVQDGSLRKIEPNRENPNGVANVNAAAQLAAGTSFAAADYFDQALAAGDTGRLCCKGNASARTLYDADRLRTPLKRVGARGSGEFVAISWQQALQETALGLLASRAKYGARSIVWCSEEPSFNAVQQDLCDALGTPNFTTHASTCDVARRAYSRSTLGEERLAPDMEGADLLLVFGWNFLSAIRWMHLPAIFARGRARNPGFRFVYVDPVHNVTASKADVWLAPRPGTDGALALALCKILVDRGSYDRDFVAGYALGFEEFRKYLEGDGTYDREPKTAAWAGEITGIPAQEIERLGAELAAAFAAGKRICVDSSSGPGHHTNGTQAGRAIHALMLLLGAVDRPGTNLVGLRSGPSRRPTGGMGWPAKDGWRLDGRDDVTIPPSNPDGSVNPVSGAVARKYVQASSAGIYVELRDCILEQRDFAGNPYPIKSAVFAFQNFVMSTPNTQLNIDALQKLEFVVCVDTHLSETALLADIVVPGSHWLERYDLNTHPISFRAVGLRQPVVPSWIAGLTETQFFLELGAALGFRGFKTTPGKDDTEENYLKEQWDRFVAPSSGWQNPTSWLELKQRGVWVEPASSPKGGTQWLKYRKTATFADGDRVLPVAAGAETAYVVADASGKAKGIAKGPAMSIGDTYEVGFATESRRAQFWYPTLAKCFSGAMLPAGRTVAGDARYHPLPVYLPPQDGPSSEYPLHFISWKEVEHSNTRTFNNDWLMQLKKENQLFIHPDAAAVRGLIDGDLARVTSAFGEVQLKVHVTPAIQPETVGFFRGFGHWAMGDLARGRGAHDGWLLPGRAEIHSGQAVLKEVGCQVSKVIV